MKSFIWLTLSILLIFNSPALADDFGPDDFLKSMIYKADVIKRTTELTDLEKEYTYESLFRVSFDVPKVSEWIMGRYWRLMSTNQRNEFVQLFGTLTVKRFAPLIKEASFENLKIERVSPANKKDYYFVYSTYVKDDNEKIKIVWTIAKSDNGLYKIFDVVAEGISFITVFRSEYGSVAKRSGIDGLLYILRRKVQEYE